MTRVVDALVEDESDVLRFRGGRIFGVANYEFRADALRGLGIFKVPNLRVSPTFVGGGFIELWLRSNLKGLKFEKIWPTA